MSATADIITEKKEYSIYPNSKFNSPKDSDEMVFLVSDNKKLKKTMKQIQ